MSSNIDGQGELDVEKLTKGLRDDAKVRVTLSDGRTVKVMVWKLRKFGMRYVESAYGKRKKEAHPILLADMWAEDDTDLG